MLTVDEVRVGRFPGADENEIGLRTHEMVTWRDVLCNAEYAYALSHATLRLDSTPSKID